MDPDMFDGVIKALVIVVVAAILAAFGLGWLVAKWLS